MALNLPDLDAHTRRYMLDELEADVRQGCLHLSPYLTDAGQAAFESALRAALRAGTAETLAEVLRRPGWMETPTGWHRGGQIRGLPSTAPDGLAEAEFHRFYVRGLCRRAIAEGIRTLVIYRARDGEPRRAGANGMVGVRIDAASLLEDFRTTTGRVPPRVLAGCADGGMSVRLPTRESSDREAGTPEVSTIGLSKAERRRLERRTAERRRADRNTPLGRAIHGR